MSVVCPLIRFAKRGPVLASGLLMKLVLLSLLLFVWIGCATTSESKRYNVLDYSALSEDVKRHLELAYAGDASAQNELAIDYDEGRGGLVEDDEQAVYWFRRGAEGGDAYAMSNLGLMYQYGNGVAQDFQQAAYWYEQAANAGNTDAMAHLGTLHAYGRLGAVDFDAATRWYRKSLLGPFDPDAANDAAWFFSTVEDPKYVKSELAINLMMQVISMRERHYELDTLAAAYAANGDFDEAIFMQQKALELGYESDVSQDELGEFEDRLAVYFGRNRYIHFKR